MPDDRSLEDPVEALRAMRAEYDDRLSTLAARAGRMPTGTILASTCANPRPNTLFCQGQTVSRATYADLWKFAQESGGVASGLYGPGDGSTTFRLPDLRGRVIIGAGTLGTDTYALGATGGLARVALAAAEVSGHTHTVTINPGGAGHSSFDGDHDGHIPGGGVVQGGTNAPAALASFHERGGHTHFIDEHSHSATAAAGAANTAHENRPPYTALNVEVWT